MTNKEAFSQFHPFVNFLYFGIIFGFSCVCVHPVCIGILFISGLLYYLKIKGRKALRLLFKAVLPLMLLCMVINPVFSHEGVTILWYFPSGNPLTLESILYGISGAFILSSILLWFACFSEIVTSDKFVYLFGRIIPALALLLSMTLRFVPRFKKRFEEVKDVQGALGYDTKNGSVFRRIKNAITCFSCVVTWSLENGIDTSDSMKSRGYGTGRRTSYSIYHWTSQDKVALIIIVLAGLFLLIGGITGNLSWRYYPNVKGVLLEPITIFNEIILAALCLMPLIINKKEEIVWKHLKSKI